MNTWAQQLTGEIKAKMDEDELYVQALKAAFSDSSALNDIAIVRVLIQARVKGLDGRKILQKAFNERFGGVSLPSPNTNNVVLDQARVAVVSQKTTEPGFQCPNPKCGEVFKTQAQLSGHGPNRCIKKKR